MAQPPSKTSNHQRLKEMMCHLTPRAATVPYTLCFDSSNNLWVASKGGLFKFSGTGYELVFERKNIFPKKIAPYCQVVYSNSKIVYVVTEASLTEFRILNLDGEMEHEQFVDGKIQSVAINNDGEIFMTKQPEETSDDSVIYKSYMDCPLGWEELSTAYDFCFQALCVYDENTLAVATASLPVNIYSKQSIKWIDAKSGKILGSFSSSGKEDGQIYFPRGMQRYGDDILVMDKTGRIQRFMRTGGFTEVSARIDSYIGNGFVVRGDEAVIACSGIVLCPEGESICDDWVESIKLDGSRWTQE